MPGKLGCWPNCSLRNISAQKLLCSEIQKYLCWQGNGFYASTSVSCRKKSEFVLMEDTRFNFSPGLITESTKIDPVLLFTAFRGLCSDRGEKLKFCLLSPDLNWKITCFASSSAADCCFPCSGCSSSLAVTGTLSLLHSDFLNLSMKSLF